MLFRVIRREGLVRAALLREKGRLIRCAVTTALFDETPIAPCGPYPARAALGSATWAGRDPPPGGGSFPHRRHPSRPARRTARPYSTPLALREPQGPHDALWQTERPVRLCHQRQASTGGQRLNGWFRIELKREQRMRREVRWVQGPMDTSRRCNTL